MGITHARNLASIPGIRVVVVAGPIREAAERGQAASRAERAETDIAAAINDPAVDAVVISTPTHTHAELIEQAARAGKAIWSEKPIALDLQETKRIVDIVRDTAVPVQLGFMRLALAAKTSWREGRAVEVRELTV
jgi:myo-inositol 2-dehydrogenase/D-chiro-inositol 1-dehydrogenase